MRLCGKEWQATQEFVVSVTAWNGFLALFMYFYYRLK